MATFEEEFERLIPTVLKLSNFFLLGKKIRVVGKENFIRKGCTIITGNHIGSFKDVATLLKIVPRPIFFIANQEIFSRKEFNDLITRHLRRHLKNIGLFVELMLKPIKTILVDFISSNVSKVGTIPVDLSQKKRLAVSKMQEYLKQGRAIIALQGRGRVHSEYAHPYVTPFKRGIPIITYNLYREGILVPVTPLAFFGTHFPFMVPKTIQVNVGQPMYISDFLKSGVDETIEEFRRALEAKVKELFREIINPR